MRDISAEKSFELLVQWQCGFNISKDHTSSLDPLLIEHAHRLILSYREEDPDVDALAILGKLHMSRYIALGEKARGEWQTAVAMFARCLIYGGELPLPIAPDVLTEAASLATELLMLRDAEATDDLVLADRAVDAWQRINAVTPADHPDKADYLLMLSSALLMRRENMNERADLEEAINVGRELVQATSIHQSEHAEALHHLGHMLSMRFSITEDPADMDEMISVWEQALRIIPEGDGLRATLLASIGAELLRRYLGTGSPPGLDRFIATTRQALRTAPADHQYREGALFSLNTRLEQRSQKIRATEAIEPPPTVEP
ncbi:hypothetical protein [Nonomuraea sp. KM90]|uniref:hypothetical protein n=1 Tax=Nonomuraea sp. KM90 TaxID=3457428 RepID=UPI003FCE2D85